MTRFDWKGFTGCDIACNYTGCEVLKLCTDPDYKCKNQMYMVFFALPLTVAIVYAWKFTCHIFISVYPPKKGTDYAVCTVLSDEFDSIAAGFFVLLFIAFFTCFNIIGSLKWQFENISEP